MDAAFPPRRRFRRLRLKPAVRDLVRETRLGVEDLIAPVFVKPSGPPEPIASLPGMARLNPEDAVSECRDLEQLGLRAVALFPCVPPELKDHEASRAIQPDQFFHQALRQIRSALPGLVMIADVALDPYTPHGHDGVLNAAGQVDNDRTVGILARMAVLQAGLGVDWVAPSDMMDGRVAAIRSALDQAGHPDTAILAYAAKFASAYYGPFRDAVGSKKNGDGIDKRTYQIEPANRRQAVADALLDEAEGADLLMVKPAGLYLDVLHALRSRTDLPLVAYQVSGEYAQLHAAAEKGWLDLERTRDESLLAIKRSGADLIITYFAKSLALQGAFR
ncbi:MAG: porphobilinogen synthase [Candidatus Methylacidiphilales bacterium]|nr:porphobilinogen synthase [Candidatus Methylacidiphilales bacterium]